MNEQPDLTFMTEAEARPLPGDRVFRERRLGKFLMSVMFFALTCGLAAGAWLMIAEGGMGVVAGVFLAVMTLATLIIFLIALAGFRASGHPSNWILRATPEGLFVHYRSYLNNDIPADSPTVVLLPHREIDWVRTSQQTQSQSFVGDKRTEKRRYLEIGFRRTDISAIEAKLSEERTLVSGRKSRFNHFPVDVDDGFLRIEWRSPRTSIHPGLQKALQILGRDYPAVPGNAEVLDDDSVTDPTEQEARIRGHLARGEMIIAVKLARKYFGYDLTESRQYAEDLKESL